MYLKVLDFFISQWLEFAPRRKFWETNVRLNAHLKTCAPPAITKAEISAVAETKGNYILDSAALVWYNIGKWRICHARQAKARKSPVGL
jgi:hypothetical protein